MTHPLVSVIIPVFNEDKVISRNLLSLINQKYKPVEIIVVDDNSTDNTVEIAKKYTPHVYKRRHSERSVQRNYGGSIAKGDYLLFLDADMELSPSVIEECILKVSSSEEIGALIIPEEPVASNFWEKVKAFERSFYNDFGDTTTDAARFFPKKVFFDAGGYDESITGPEDWDLPETIKSMGYKIDRISSRLKHYERVASPLKLAKKKYYYALKSHRYLKKHHISPVGPKTIYFFRPIFYKNWRRLVANPLLSTGMFTMFTLELMFGGAGYLIGKHKYK